MSPEEMVERYKAVNWRRMGKRTWLKDLEVFLDRESGMTLTEVGEKHGLSGSRVGDVHHKVLCRMQKLCKAPYPAKVQNGRTMDLAFL